MANRGVWQLQELVLRYCHHSGSSRGVRELLRSETLRTFAAENPQLQVRSEVKSGHHPILIGNYVTNQTKVAPIKNLQPAEIMVQAERMRNSSGRKLTKIKKPVVSKNAMVQGGWHEQMSFPKEFSIKHVY